MKTVECITLNNIPEGGNILSSHVFYEIRFLDDGQLMFSARSSPHGNGDIIQRNFCSDCSMCSPAGFRMFISPATLRRWQITNIDVKSVFLQTSYDDREVCVIALAFTDSSIWIGKCQRKIVSSVWLCTLWNAFSEYSINPTTFSNGTEWELFCPANHDLRWSNFCFVVVIILLTNHLVASKHSLT